MKLFRKVLFWLHLSAGVFAGVVVAIMSVTGVALTYEKQMLEWADLREYRSEPRPGMQRLPMSALFERVKAERGDAPPTIVLRPDAADPVAFSYGREATVYVNPYSGAVLGEGPAGLRSFFRVMTDWHRWLGQSGEGRDAGKAITGACNLAFLFIVVSGIYLWLPTTFRWPNVKAVLMFRGGLKGKARDFNWHNVIGFWSMLPLFFVVLSATIISYPWASDLVYRSVGEEPPARRVPGGPGGPGAGGPRAGGAAAKKQERSGPERKRGREGRAEGPRDGQGRSGESPDRGGRGPGGPPAEVNLNGIDALFARAGEQAPGWKRISLTIPPSGDESLTFAIDEGSGGQPQLRSTVTLDRATGSVVKWETFADGSPGRRLRSWLRFIHTGEAGGIAGQTLAGIVSAGAVVLVYTGFALAWRRFLAWLRRRRARAQEQALATGD